MTGVKGKAQAPQCKPRFWSFSAISQTRDPWQVASWGLCPFICKITAMQQMCPENMQMFSSPFITLYGKALYFSVAWASGRLSSAPQVNFKFRCLRQVGYFKARKLTEALRWEEDREQGKEGSLWEHLGSCQVSNKK